MSGHSKWANIKRQKQANDLVRGNIFSKLSRAITLTVLEGGGMSDPELNFKLRLAMEKAHQSNMPKDNIQRAIEKGSGPDKLQLKEVVYEAFGPSGVAMVILVTTDNQNRTLSEIRNILERHQAKMSHQGSVLYLFHKCGMVVFNKNNAKEEAVFAFSESMNAMDIDEDETHYTVYIPFENIGKIKEHTQGMVYETAEIDYKPINFITIADESTNKKIVSLVNALEEHADIHKVFINADIPERLLV